MFLTGCATSPSIQPHINSLVIAERFTYAAYVLEEHKEAYGERNELLYQLDSGLVYHLSGDYNKSIHAFEKAKQIYDNTLPQSISKNIDALILNDNRLPYRAEHYERILINVFQALNYVMLGDYKEAQVEARDADFQFRRWESYGQDDKEVYYYTEAFIRLFSGLIYELSPAREDKISALIDYERAYQLYARDYKKLKNISLPDILILRYATLAEQLGREDKIDEVKEKHADIFNEVHLKDSTAIVSIIYQGVSPIKNEAGFVVPIEDKIVAKFAFPVMEKRGDMGQAPSIKLIEKSRQTQEYFPTEECFNIEKAASLTHKEKIKYAVMKHALRSGMKLVAEEMIRDKIEETRGKKTANAFAYASSFYNIVSENADLRSWQTLPGRITIGWTTVKPGTYDMWINDEVVKEDVEIRPGMKQVVIDRQNFY